ncbi:MAG: hypothetical protein WCI93_01945 [bacterium]
MESFNTGEIEKEFMGDELTVRLTSFLKGKMDKVDVEAFVNEVMDDKNKLDKLVEIEDLLVKIKKAEERHKDENAKNHVKRLLKNIYGIELEDSSK